MTLFILFSMVCLGTTAPITEEELQEILQKWKEQIQDVLQQFETKPSTAITGTTAGTEEDNEPTEAATTVGKPTEAGTTNFWGGPGGPR